MHRQKICLEGSEFMNFAVIGGDARLAHLAPMLENKGHTVSCFALDNAPQCTVRSSALSAQIAAANADCVILPLPVSRESGKLNSPLSVFPHSLDDILSSIPIGTLVCAGAANREVRRLCENYGLKLVDYYSREELVILNALITAEGTISLMLQENPTTIWDSSILIIGCGRIGKMLAEKLHALGGHVSISSRKYLDMAYTASIGCTPLDTRTLGKELSGFDTIINTVPSTVLHRAQLEAVRDNALIIDLASRPGGVDFEAAKELNKKVIWALGLPAKAAPETAGKIIMDTVLNIIDEKEKEK